MQVIQSFSVQLFMTDTHDAQFSPIRMIAGNLTARPLRAVLSILAISIQVILVLMIVGLTNGVVNEWSKRVEGVGADILVQSPNASIFFAFPALSCRNLLVSKLPLSPASMKLLPL